MALNIGLELALVLSIGLALGWLAWLFAGERRMAIAVYLLFGVAGSLLGILLVYYLWGAADGVLGSLVLVPACGLATLTFVTFLDRQVS